jgi:hypothetical protein
VNPILKRLSDEDLRGSFLELFVILSMTCILFYIFETNMLMFGVFVYLGLFWIVRGVPNYKVAVFNGVIGGGAGFLTEYWGCGLHYWNWVTPCQSLWMINGMEDGFPVEVVVAYAGAGFWMGKLSLKMFAKEHDEVMHFYAHKEYLSTFYFRLSVATVINVIGISIICNESAFLQSVTVFLLGVNVLLFLPKTACYIVSSFALVVGLVGFFFENFATGYFSSFAVWKYNLSAYESLNISNPIIGVAPVSAMIAYLGIGSLLFGLSFLLNHALTEENP